MATMEEIVKQADLLGYRGEKREEYLKQEFKLLAERQEEKEEAERQERKEKEEAEPSTEEHCIELTSSIPVRQRPYPVPYAMRQTLRDELVIVVLLKPLD
ncbi:hypothetical protein PoB_006407100 [Plakobranchus ocellatus]|uniref:Uncharacterized protein n=1 Tax=Plakobranchus ocellatus TaxID=259542 RepID=A0AAV4D0H5_9GAST|nr:hypothetical protein PoB_006407100 [Plakobranchus ocellatus]